MSEIEEYCLNQHQIAILKVINQGISQQGKIAETLKLEKYLVGYYLEILKYDNFIRCIQAYPTCGEGELEYYYCNLTNKGKVALENRNNLIREAKMSENRTINTNNYYENNGIRNVNGGEIPKEAKIAGIINEAEDDNLATVAKEIQELLEQLSKHYPTKTRKDKMILTGEAIEIIEENPSLMKKLVKAVKAGSLGAIESWLNHPAASFVMNAVKDFKDDE